VKARWKTKRLSDVAQISAGNSAPQARHLFDGGTYPFFRTSDVGRIHFGDLYDATDQLNEQGIEGLRPFPQGTILFPKSGASTFLNHRVIMSVEGFVSSHLATIVANASEINQRYLLYFLATISAQDMIQDHAYPSLNLPTIAGINVPVPPLPEQNRIAAMLDEAFICITTSKAHVKKNLQNARALFESHLQSVFTHRGDGWVEKPMGQLCDVKDGTHDSPKYIAEGIPFVTQKNVTENGLSFKKIKFITQADHDNFYRRSNVAYGDILISMIGANRGMACIVDDKRIFSIKNVGLVKKNDSIDQNFLLYFLKSSGAAEYIRSKSKGGAQEFVGLTELRSFPIPTTSLPRQKSIVYELDTLAAETQRLESIYQQELAALEALKESLLHQAFTGVL
jgi:type I restriction enzyme S subunit